MISDCLFKRNNVYYFRLNIPLDIAPYFSRREIWKSLKTRDYKSAKTTLSKLLYTTERLFLHLRSGMYTEVQMKQLVKDYLQEYLDRCEGIRSIAMVTYKREGQKYLSSDADAQTIVDSSISAIDELIESSKRKLLFNDFSGLNVRVDRYFKEKGLEVDKESVEYTTFCREILKAEIEALKVEKERISGNYDNRYDNFLENTIAPAQQAILQPATINTPAEPIVTLSRVIEENIKEAALGGNWNEKTKAENESIYKVIIEVLGDVEIKSITHPTMMEFRNKLAKLPPNRDKKPQYKGKTIEQILAMKNVPAMSRTTLNKYLVRTSTLFKWSVKHGYIQTNVAEGLTLPKVGRAEQERQAYSTEDIQKILNHLVYNKTAPHLFWIPILGMFQGMRIDEICQLYVSDVVVVEGTPCISINREADKKLKNDASERIIPIHGMLIRLGFMEYVDELLRNTLPTRHNFCPHPSLPRWGRAMSSPPGGGRKEGGVE